MNENLLEQIAKNTKRTANNLAFFTYLTIFSLLGSVGIALQILF